MEDLWPEDIGTPKTKSTVPVAILKEQGKLLGEKTKNIVVGSVSRMEAVRSRITPNFAYSFVIEGTALGYLYRLFAISHPISLYPVTFTELDADIREELKLGSKDLPSANHEEEFKTALRRIFASQKLKDLVSAILAQSSEM